MANLDVEHHREAITAAFHKFDINGDGKISEDELKAVLKILDPSFTPADLDSIFLDADLSKDGVMNMDEFAAWAVAPLGFFGTVPANAARAISDEDRAAMKIQAVARGRAARKTAAVKRSSRKGDLGVVKAMTIGELWEGLALRSGTIRKRVDVPDVVSGFKFCKRTGLTVEIPPLLSPLLDSEPEDLSPDEVSHLCLLIQSRQTDVDEAEARKQIAVIKDEARKSDHFGAVHESLKCRHFKNVVHLISRLMLIDQDLLLEHWYWAEFGLFLPSAPLQELLLTTVVYSKARLASLVSKGDEASVYGSLVNHPFHIKDLMLLSYNGGLIGVPDQICLTSEEVQATWPKLLRSVGELTLRHINVRKAVAAGKIYQDSGKVKPTAKDDPKHFLSGPLEIALLIDMLHSHEKMKNRFASPLAMMISMVKHAQVHGRLWDEDQPGGEDAASPKPAAG